MRQLPLIGIAIAALVAASVAFTAPPRTVTVTGKVRAVTPAAINVAGTACVLAPIHPRSMMPTIIRELDVGGQAQMTCVRANGKLTVAKLVEKPAGVIIVSGAVTATTSSSVTVRGVTCLVPGNRKKPVLGMPTIIKGAATVGGLITMACTQVGDRLTVSALAER